MKRTWIFTALFFCGLVSFSGLQASTSNAKVVSSQQLLTAPSLVELEILRAAAKQLDMSFSDIMEHYYNDNVTIDRSGTMVIVTVSITEGTPLIASLEDNF
ncbi:MAG TPA: hypothetical protein ENJ82_03455 [Bacteroidetes bacterium]|nr:hypothetical protein [Bacteroidota bacterium]